MERNTFEEICRMIARLKGEKKTFSLNHQSKQNGEDILEYKDDMIVICVDKESLKMTITRLENNNPVVYVDSTGKNFRSHGEQYLLFDHVAKLAKEMLEEK